MWSNADSLLAETDTLSLLSITTRGAPQSNSLREGLKSLTSSSCFRDVLRVIAIRTLPRYEATMEENIFLRNLKAT